MSDDFVPELADAIIKLINASPRSPSKDELMQVIRDHVSQELFKATGSTWGEGAWGPVTVPVGSGSVTINSPVTGTTVTKNLIASLPPIEPYTEGGCRHEWAHLHTWVNDLRACYTIEEMCSCGRKQTREIPFHS